jgi:POT family proton-dependent oligopeptide transporter
MIPGIMWGQNFNLIAIWGVLAGICLVSALFIFSIIKKLNRVS